MSKKRLLSIVVSAVILLSFACTAMAAEKSERYVGDSTVNGSIYQTYYQVDAQTRTGVKRKSAFQAFSMKRGQLEHGKKK